MEQETPTDIDNDVAPLFRVLQPGLMTTVQGLGQAGMQRYGVAVGGAMDTASLRIANALVRNQSTAHALEITLAGPVLEVLADTVLSIAGADLSLAIDGTLMSNGHSFRASAGSLITFARRRHTSGARCYLAARGGIRRTRTSRSVRLVKGEILRFEHAPAVDDRPLLHLSDNQLPLHLARLRRVEPAGAIVLRVIEGPHWDRFSKSGHDTFLTGSFEINHESNRVGIRLIGPRLDLADGAAADILSEPTPLGTIQVPASGQPILLMADRPVTGGYAKIATVISTDIPRAAQLAPGDTVRFEVVTLDQAHQAAVEIETELRLIERLATW